MNKIARRRQLFTAIHRYLGLATLAFLLVAAVTGCLLCIDTRLDAALNPDLFRSQAGGSGRDVIPLVDSLEATQPELIVTQFPLASQPGRTIKAIVSGRGRTIGFDQIFLDPADGRVAGTRQSGAGLDRRHIVDAVFAFHYTLLAGKWGRWLMGLAALGWLIGNVIGAYLTLPVAQPFWRKWRRMWEVDFKARLRWLMVDLHRACGLWLLIGLTILAFTSVAMNFFDEAFTPAVSALSPAKPSPFDRPPLTGPAARGRIGFRAALDKAKEVAQRDGLTWRPAVETYLPDRGLYGVMFTASGEEEYRGLGPITYYVDALDGRFVHADDPYADSAGRKLSRALYPLHSGEVIGPLGTAIIFLLGLATSLLCVTGTYIWWKKRASRLKRR